MPIPAAGGKKLAFRQVDVTRAIRAARAAGAPGVSILVGDAVINVDLSDDGSAFRRYKEQPRAGKRREIVL